MLDDEDGRDLPAVVHHGCPMVPCEVGQAMIDRLEKQQIRLLRKAQILKSMMLDPSVEMIQSIQQSTEMAMTYKLKTLFKALPDGDRLPWNRRKRRRLERAKQIALHLFSGPDSKYWEKAIQQGSVEMLCIDLQAEVSADLHDDHIYRYLLSLAASGKVKAIIGGPPCRTVSALRYQEDGGPGILRTEEYPYGLPTWALVTGDRVLLFRTLALYMLREDVRHEQEPQTALAVEQPEDPAHYRPVAEVQEKGFMSIWRTQEWQAFADAYDITLLHFDQGPMGHVKRKPTTLAAELRDVQALDGIRGPPSGVEAGDQQDRNRMSMQERCDNSKTWASWASGLKGALVLALQEHLHRGATPSLAAAMRPLGQVALEGWRNHNLNDHMPARRDCKHCVRTSAQSRPHRRIIHPESYTLSVDLSGKMVVGQDQSRHDCRYMMIAVYTFLAAWWTVRVARGGWPGGDCGGGGGDQRMAWQQEVEKAQDVTVRNLTFVEVLPGSSVQHILPALARIYARLRSLGLPLYRIHCDRARELISAPVRRWTLDRGIVNSLTSTGLDSWPLATIHIGERRLRGQLRSLGTPVGPLLQFGARAFALKKSWQDRYEPWRELRDELIFLGPALLSSLTSTCYYVQSVERKRCIYTDDVVVPHPDQPEASEVLVHLPEIEGGEMPSRPLWDGNVPRRRLREKTAVPSISMLHMEGEISSRVQNWLRAHRDAFDAHAPNDAELFKAEWSSDSWTIETPSKTSSSAGEVDSQDAGKEEVPTGRGDVEEAPNSQDGGSSLAASIKKMAPGRFPFTKVQLLRFAQANLAEYVKEEMGHLDITNLEQGWYMVQQSHHKEGRG